MRPKPDPTSPAEHSLELCIAQRDNIRAIFDSVEDAIFTVDRDRTIGEANSSFLRMIGMSPEEAMGRAPTELVHLAGASLGEVIERTFGGETIRGLEVEIMPPEGGRHLAVLSSAPLRDRERELGGAVVVLHDVTRLRALEEDLRLSRGRGGLVGDSVLMREVYELIDQIAAYDVTVLVTGESGTGKELAAAAIHEASHRSRGPFVRVNCAGLSETLLESELFGHVRGSFTGAVEDRMGRFEAAHEGTIFLDEIGAVSSLVQKRLLRILQEGEYERVGETRTRKADVRVIAATNADLRRLVEEGRFREDLYYRLQVVEIRMPPLRERREDIPVIAEHLLAKHARRMGREAMSLSPAALAVLMSYGWEGNVRQLENAIQRAIVVARGRIIRRTHLPPEILAGARVGSGFGGHGPRARARSARDEEEAQRLRAALEKAGGRIARAAEILGVHRTTLWRQLGKHGLRGAGSRLERPRG